MTKNYQTEVGIDYKNVHFRGNGVLCKYACIYIHVLCVILYGYKYK